MTKNLENRQDLRDATFLFLVRLDTIDRLENILAITNFFIMSIQTNIVVLECAPFNNGILEKHLDKNIMYSFQEDQDPILHRTKFLNQMTRTVKTPYIAVWDTDVLVQVSQIGKAVELLRNGEADFVYPYEEQFLDTSPILRKLFLQEGKIEILAQNLKKMKAMYSSIPLGGAFIANLNAYKEAGLENEDFYGWGMEDGERFYRRGNLGYKIKRVPGPLFHLSHGRGINSVFHNIDQQFFKHKEVIRVRRNKNLDHSEFVKKQNPIK